MERPGAVHAPQQPLGGRNGVVAEDTSSTTETYVPERLAATI